MSRGSLLNALNQSTQVGATPFTDDPFGRRISQTISAEGGSASGGNGTTTRFLYDGEQLLAETDAAGAITATYIFGPGIDEVLQMERNGQVSYYHPDPLGSIVALTDGTGTLVERYEYDAFGQPTLFAPDGTVRPTSALANRFLFTGREYDAETRLYFYRNRYYHPGLGRFLQRDPLTWGPDDPRIFAARNLENHLLWFVGLPGFSVDDSTLPLFSDVVSEHVVRTGGSVPTLHNLYPYVGNNPVTLVDPFGLYSLVGGYGWSWGTPLWQTPSQTFGSGTISTPTPGPVPGTEAWQKVAQGKPQGAQQPGVLTAQGGTKNGIWKKAKEILFGLVLLLTGQKDPRKDPKDPIPDPPKIEQFYDPKSDPHHPNIPYP